MYSPKLVTWRSQYDRMERGYTRLIEPYQSSTNYEDDIQHYFQDCWHLKDWIVNDTHLSLNAVGVESEIITIGRYVLLLILQTAVNILIDIRIEKELT